MRFPKSLHSLHDKFVDLKLSVDATNARSVDKANNVRGEKSFHSLGVAASDAKAFNHDNDCVFISAELILMNGAFFSHTERAPFNVTKERDSD